MDIGLNKIKRFEYTGILGWSVSRYDKFRMCRRQYFYDYYGKYDLEYPRAKISALKSMTSLALETGNIVHDTVKTLLERLLKSEEPVDRARFTEYVRRTTERYCATKTFMERYYDGIAVDPAAIFSSVKALLDNFLNSERYAWITKKAVTNKSGWVIEPPGYGETRISGMKAYCKVDFLFPVDGDLYILDWKTGKQDEKKHRKQLIGYATWASYHFDRAPEGIFPMVAYLQGEYREMQLEVNEFDLQEFVSAVGTETKEMYGCCKSVEQNIPLPKEEFSKTANTAVCRFCNYRELCG